jgi:hypothetical protein
MQAQINVPPPAPPPGTYVPNEVPPFNVPPAPGMPPNIIDPVPEPTLPIREPGITNPPQALRTTRLESPAAQRLT